MVYKKLDKFGVDSMYIIKWIVLFQNCWSIGLPSFNRSTFNNFKWIYYHMLFGYNRIALKSHD